jgi:hypothetical protein
MGFVRVCASGREKRGRKAGGKIKIKNSSSPATRPGEEEETHCRLKWHRVVVFVFTFFFCIFFYLCGDLKIDNNTTQLIFVTHSH